MASGCGAAPQFFAFHPGGKDAIMTIKPAIQPSDLKLRKIPIAPYPFNGTRSGYIAQCLDLVLPDISEVERLHHLLVRHVQNLGETLPVRYVSQMDRGTVYDT